MEKAPPQTLLQKPFSAATIFLAVRVWIKIVPLVLFPIKCFRLIGIFFGQVHIYVAKKKERMVRKWMKNYCVF